MSVGDIKVELREKTGHHTAKELRKAGRVPAIFYTHDEDSRPLSVDVVALKRLIQSEINVLNVIFPDGKVRKSIFREIQRDPVTDAPIHIDIMGIKLTEKVRLSIPLVLNGVSVGVKEGGILEHLIREVEVEGLPLDLPEHLEVDVSELDIGDVITLEALKAEKFRFVTDIHHAVATVIHPKVIKEDVVEEEVEVEEGEEAEATTATEEETRGEGAKEKKEQK